MKLIDRRHKILTLREAQLQRNALALAGGRPYIEARLWRAPNESDLSWEGNRAGVVGRKDRAALVNDAGRVANKINHYLFKVAATRTGIDENWAGNVDGAGTTIQRWWDDLSLALTAGQWVWVQVDRLAPIVDPETGEARWRTLLERERDRDLVMWTLWPATAVPDWSFDERGELLWIMTESQIYDNADPHADAQEFTLRTLWRRSGAGVEITRWKRSGEGAEQVGETISLTAARLPFVLVGWPSVEPWWFDDVELLQAQILNLDSLHIENLVRTIFPQLVIPESMLANLEVRLHERIGAANGEKIVEAVREIVRGLDAPFVESAEDSGITRFIQPSAGELAALPDEQERKRRLLFDNAGLALFNKESRQIQTAESKQFDLLDTEATLKHRAQVLQEAERALVAISREIDPLFAQYDPVWPASFDVVDVQGDTAALTMIDNLPGATLSMRKLALLAALRVLQEIGGQNQELFEAAEAEVMELEEDDLTSSMPAMFD